MTQDFNTSHVKKQASDDNNGKGREQTCPACSKPHKPENCETFLKRSLKERSELAKSKGIGFLCLRHGHIVKQCKESVRRHTSKKPHATILHFESKNDKNEIKKKSKPKKDDEGPKEEKKRVANRVVVCHNNESKDATASCLILPVRMWYKHNPDKKIMSYAV